MWTKLICWLRGHHSWEYKKVALITQAGPHSVIAHDKAWTCRQCKECGRIEWD